MEIKNVSVSFDEENRLRIYDDNGVVITFFKSGEANIPIKRFFKLEEQINELRAENKELKKANKVMQDRLMEEGYCAQCEWMEDEMTDMEERLDAANAKIAKLEHKIERKDKYIEKIRHENDLLESKCRLRESDLKCLEKMYFELDERMTEKLDRSERRVKAVLDDVHIARLALRNLCRVFVKCEDVDVEGLAGTFLISAVEEYYNKKENKHD